MFLTKQMYSFKIAISISIWLVTKAEYNILSMAVLKFRAYYEEDDAVYRDVVIKHSQTFFDLHNCHS